ncbi:MAG: hypothetical protein DRK00_09620 [Thermoprotei archaeon]|nr:MAG: hypothetical protein DRK00_09620 [Thermoprotei archaeon]
MMQGELEEKLKALAKKAEEIANTVSNEYRIEVFARTYGFLLRLHEDELAKIRREAEVISVAREISEIKELSLPEFLGQIELKNNPERMTAIAYYMRIVEGLEEFTLKDLLERWREAALKMPGNPRRDLREAIRRGWISPTSDKKQYYITRTGIKFIENKLKPVESSEGK